MKYERLTNEELNDFTSRVVVQLEPTLTQQVMSLILELTEYRTKIENGTLVELPCKVGDTVWEIIQSPNGNFISKEIISDYWITEDGIVARTGLYTTDRIEIEEFGKTVFLTKAEAEQKLKELEK